MKLSIVFLLCCSYVTTSVAASVRGNDAEGRVLKKGSKKASKKGQSKKEFKKSASVAKKSKKGGDMTPGFVFSTRKPPAGVNICAGKGDPRFENINCFADDGVDVAEGVGGQAGVNVTKGYNGNLNADHEPIKVPYYTKGLCPVNVHWHLGTEHYSLGQFDETGTGPTPVEHRRRLAGKARKGYQCKLFDEDESMYTTPYDWKYCVGMEIGQTYEVHWPHSALGDCGTPNQYQTPFYDGVLCLPDRMVGDLQDNVGVQSQVYTIVNDEDYYYPDMFKGMTVDGNMGQDIAMFTGSTTGTSRNNTICSAYSPITWQVDRVCHKISASSFDKMCADMLSQRDDMSDDLYAHGSRELVDDKIAHNNHANRN